MKEGKGPDWNDPTESMQLSWRDDWWLAQNMLTAETVLEYFSGCPFYNKKSNNAFIQMQRLDMSLLKEMEGIQYEILPQQSLPNSEGGENQSVLFVIREIKRSISPDRKVTVTPMAMYHILNGTVFKSPDVLSSVSARLSRSVYEIQTAFDAIKDHLGPNDEDD